jgi:hypothetical protein
MSKRVITSLVIILSCASSVSSWTTPPALGASLHSPRQLILQATEKEGEYQTIFDFSVNETLSKIDRLDDVIMGGISSSNVVKNKNDDFARWAGVCRTDGGGFCGFRTNPFETPLNVGDADGFYMTCRLASDEESQRRVWKVTTRVEQSRGEQLYQAPFDLVQKGDEWSTIKVPFSSFRLVRGPRTVPDGEPLNTTGGLYQFGSKSNIQVL